MEAIITIVGFLGAGKTTLLKQLTTSFIDKGWNPFVILNDYENAYLDSQQLAEQVIPQNLKALNGSCICCSGIHELRNIVNRIPKREKGITLIEANGTSDACSLMEFLGVGLHDNFLPPIQISVVDAKNWQKRGAHNDLEANQIQVSSLIILTHLEEVDAVRKDEVCQAVIKLNPLANIVDLQSIDVLLLPTLLPSNNKAEKMEHLKSHWSSCSVDLPELPTEQHIAAICNKLPKTILRLKGCTKIANETNYTYFERTPDGKIHIRPFRGEPITGPKLLSIGPGSSVSLLDKAIALSLNNVGL